MSETTTGAPAGSAAETGELGAWRKLTTMALEAVAEHSAKFSVEERSAFGTRIHESLKALEEATSETSQVLITAGSLAQAIEQHGTETQSRYDGLVEQFRQMTRVLMERGARIPDELKQSIEAALSARDLLALTDGLGGCLEAAKAAPQVSFGIESITSGGSDSPASSTDPCTGLPMRVDAESVIRRAVSSAAQAYVAAFYIHRMNLINARFGEAIGNQVILFCSQHIATNLAGSDTLFRWRGPGFVAVMERNESPLAIASEVQRFTAMPLSRFFETPSRTVYLPIKLTAEVLPTSGRSFEEVIDQVQRSLHANGLDD